MNRPNASGPVLGTLLAVMALAGCGSAPTSTTLTVSAASSLTGAFTAIGTAFEKEHPGVSVSFNFGGSSTLAEQIAAGAPVDVFASASKATMDTVVAAQRAGSPRLMARNAMAIVVPPSNPAGITSLADVARPGVRVVVCQESVPCGAAARAVFTNAGVTVTPASLEPDVKSVLAKVSADEVDAGIVYITDVLAAGPAVGSVTIPAGINVSTAYYVVAMSDSTRSDLASQFVEFVLGPTGQDVMSTAGFQAP